MFFCLFGSSPPTPYLIHKKTIQALKRWLFWGSSLPSSLSAGSQIKSLGLNTLSQIYRPILRWAEQDIFHGSFRETLLTMCVPDAQSCLTLRDPMDCSLPGSSVHGILQERILEWVAVPFSRGSSQLRDQTDVSHTVGRFCTIWATREASANGKCI